MTEEYDEEEGNIYDEENRENLVADGEISAEEEAFMRGYDEAGFKEEEGEEDEE